MSLKYEPSSLDPRQQPNTFKTIIESTFLKGRSEKSLNRARKVDVRLRGKGNSNTHGARPVHLIITMIKWIRTRRLSIKNSLSE